MLLLKDRMNRASSCPLPFASSTAKVQNAIVVASSSSVVQPRGEGTRHKKESAIVHDPQPHLLCPSLQNLKSRAGMHFICAPCSTTRSVLSMTALRWTNSCYAPSRCRSYRRDMFVETCMLHVSPFRSIRIASHIS